MNQYRQMQIAMTSLGPLFPTLLRQLSRLPLLRGHEIAQYLCCEPPQQASAERLSRIQADFQASIANSNFQLVKIDPHPLSMSHLKETYLITVNDKNTGDRQLVLQILRPGIEKALKADIQALQGLQNQSELIQSLADTGIKNMNEMIETLKVLIADEIDFKGFSSRQKQAQQVYRQVHPKIEITVSQTIEGFQNQKYFSLQEFGKGLKISEARATYPELVNLALESFAETYIKEALLGSGFVWAEPSERNIRIEIQENGKKAKLTLLGIAFSESLTADQLKVFYSSLAKLPLSKLMRPQNLQNLIEHATETGIQLNPQTLKFAQGFLHLRELIGPEKFQKLVIKTSISNPSLLWSVLGPKMKDQLAKIYQPFLKLLQRPALHSQNAGQVKCRSVHQK